MKQWFPALVAALITTVRLMTHLVVVYSVHHQKNVILAVTALKDITKSAHPIQDVSLRKIAVSVLQIIIIYFT